MAQTTKWLPAILDYMKNVMSNISTSLPDSAAQILSKTDAVDTLQIDHKINDTQYPSKLKFTKCSLLKGQRVSVHSVFIGECDIIFCFIKEKY